MLITLVTFVVVMMVARGVLGLRIHQKRRQKLWQQRLQQMRERTYSIKDVDYKEKFNE